MTYVQDTNQQLHDYVVKELMWDQGVTAEHIFVTANRGVVTLRGNVKDHVEKATAEKAAQRVPGARAVVNGIEVDPSIGSQRTDEAIARAALAALDAMPSVTAGVRIAVEQGWVSLRGGVQQDCQRAAAAEAVRQVVGVRGVTNEMTLDLGARPPDAQASIETARAMGRGSFESSRNSDDATRADAVAALETARKVTAG